MSSDLHPVKIVIAALGGEGGSVLTKWIVEAAERTGYRAQYTSIPGVAQRTGATTYYIELFPLRDGLIFPVLALTPSPCDVDIVIASELLEVGRAIEKGLVSPTQTTLIGSTHRMYAVSEKSTMTDNRYNSETIKKAAEEFAAELVLADLRSVSEQAGSIINAVLLGALAATEKLPIAPEVFEDVIRQGGKAVESNLTGFSAGYALVRKSGIEPSSATPEAQIPHPVSAEIQAEFPEIAHQFVAVGTTRTTEYQSTKYSRLYVDRLRRILSIDKANGGDKQNFALTLEMARYLALRMTYEDVVRVAELKTSAERLREIRLKSATNNAIIDVVDYFKPGIEEIRAALPPVLSNLLKPLEARAFHRSFTGGLKIRTTTVSGYYTLRFLANFKRWRPRSSRYLAEQQNIDKWLDNVIRIAGLNYQLAVEYAECANLLKGYGDTYHRGLQNFNILTTLVDLILLKPDSAAILKNLRQSALKDPDGVSFDQSIKSTVGYAA